MLIAALENAVSQLGERKLSFGHKFWKILAEGARQYCFCDGQIFDTILVAGPTTLVYT
jgi:hypothetical protein